MLRKRKAHINMKQAKLVHASKEELEQLINAVCEHTGYTITQLTDKLDISYSRLRAYVRLGAMPERIILELNNIMNSKSGLEQYELKDLFNEIKRRGWDVQFVLKEK